MEDVAPHVREGQSPRQHHKLKHIYRSKQHNGAFLNRQVGLHITSVEQNARCRLLKE